MTLRTRSLEKADIPAVAAWLSEMPLWRRYGLARAKAEAQLAAALAGDLVLTADIEEARACGLAWCLRKGMFGQSPYLKLFGVRPDVAGRGVGRRLLQDLEAELAGERDLFLLVSDFNAAAQRFYQRHGFAQVGSIGGYVLPEVSELLYRKPLEGFSASSESGTLDVERPEREEP